MKLYLMFMVLCFSSVYVNAGSTVYKCKDSRGKIVFQQVACNESQVTGDSTAHTLWRKMRALSSEGKNILLALGANIESIKQCNRDMAKFNVKLEDLSPAVRQVGRQYQDLNKAYSYLKDCGVCRTSAEGNCRTADKYLDQAVSKLTEY